MATVRLFREDYGACTLGSTAGYWEREIAGSVYPSLGLCARFLLFASYISRQE